MYTAILLPEGKGIACTMFVEMMQILEKRYVISSQDGRNKLKNLFSLKGLS